MQNLITQLTINTGLKTEQVQVVIGALATYVKEKYPLLAATVDMVLEQQVPVAPSN